MKKNFDEEEFVNSYLRTKFDTVKQWILKRKCELDVRVKKSFSNSEFNHGLCRMTFILKDLSDNFVLRKDGMLAYIAIFSTTA